jgi:hypothetical protein
MIAGTGRAGTSFLVRWLAAMGLPTHLATHETPHWHEDANAGLEDLPVDTDWETAPYVMKSPWLAEVIDQVLADPHFVLDGVIIPVRDLRQAATSRVVQELQAGHRKFRWMSDLSRSFEQWGTTPGGVVYSLDPVDQARLLAVSFHHLVQRLLQADVPFVLLDFPRLAQDPDYLFGKLSGCLPANADLAKARAVHAAIADPEKIRVGRELAAMEGAEAAEFGRETLERLDAVALRREVRRLADALSEATQTAASQQEEVAALRALLQGQAAELARLGTDLATRAARLQNAQERVAAPPISEAS